MIGILLLQEVSLELEFMSLKLIQDLRLIGRASMWVI